MTEPTRRVFNVSAGQDTGGQIVRLMRAFERYSTSWTMTGLAMHPTYLAYPGDVSIPRRQARGPMTALWNEADVVHAHRQLLTFELLDKANRKPIVLNHHGSSFRADPAQMLADARHIGAVSVVSTIDLLRYDPELVWLPAPYSLADLAALRREHRQEGGPVRIVHAPTNRQVKSTDVVQAAVSALARRHDIVFDLIEGVSWAECMARKAKADILVDQLTLGYGNNAVEAWGMGIPVIAGTTDSATRERMISILGDLPFVEATEQTLITRLEEMIVNAPLRVAWGTRGLAYVRRWHDDRKVVRQAEGLYERAIAERRPTNIIRTDAPRPTNRIVRVRDADGQIRRMTPARAKLHGFEVVAA